MARGQQLYQRWMPYPWFPKLPQLCQRQWMPLLLGILASIAVVILWQQLNVQEQLHIQQLVQQESEAVELELNRELSHRILALERMAYRWQMSGGTPHYLWEADATNYINHAEGYQAIAWVDDSLRGQWVVPQEGNEAIQRLDLNREPHCQANFILARDQRRTVLTRPLALMQGGKGFLAVMPLYVANGTVANGTGERFDGFIVGAFQFQAFFDSLLPGSHRYQIQIFDHNDLIYSQGVASTFPTPETVAVQAFGADWRVQILPTPGMITAERSLLPAIELWGGLLSAWTLALAVYLGQRSERHARRSRKINQQLQQEIMHRQQAEANLEASEERWKLAILGSNDGIWDWNVQTNEVFFSSRWKAMLGFEEHEIANHLDEWAKRVHPDDLGWVTALVQDHFAQKTPFYISEHRVQGKDGSYKWILDRGQAIWDEAGNVIRMVGSHTDIDDRKQAEQALEDELLRNITLFNTSIDGIVMLNHQGDVIQSSPSFAQMLGYTVKETLKLNLVDWDAQWTQEELQEILKGSFPIPPLFETRHRRRDGSLYDAEISYSRVELDGEVVHFCICRDISDRKRHEAERKHAEELLRFSQEKFEALVTNMPGMVYRYFPNTAERPHHFTFVSSHSYELLELSPEAVVQDANTFVNLIHPDDLPSFVSSVSYAVEHFLPWHWEGRITTPSGRLKWIEGNSQAQCTAEGGAWDGLLLDISDRKRSEIALKNSQARFAGILEIASDAIISVDVHQHITLFNKGAERIFGYKAEDILGQPLEQLLPDRLVHKHHHHVTQYSPVQVDSVQERGGQCPPLSCTESTCTLLYTQSEDKARIMAQRSTIMGRRKDGTEFPAEASISKLTLDGEVTFTAFLQDVTARQEAEVAVARLAAIIESSGDAIVSKSLEGVVTSWNPAAETLFGYTAAEMIGHTITRLIPSSLRGEEQKILERIRHGERISSYDTQRRRKDGSLIDVSISVSPIKDATGHIVGVSKIARDISERKYLEDQQHQAEENLRHQKEMFQAIVNHIPVMIALFNEEGRIDFINPEFEQVLGWPLEEWQQRDVMVDCYPDPVYRQSVLEHMTTALGNWRDFATLTARGQTIETSWTNVRLSGGRFLGIGQDVSDRKHKEMALQQAMEAAEAANLAKSMFLANMSHELRTPLNVILGFTQVMSHDASLTPGQKEDLKTIHRSGDHLLSLINDVLDLSKIEAGHCTLDENGFDLISLLHTLRTMMTERARAKHLQLTFDIAPNVPQFVIADEQKLRQILLNLLSNAIKFTDQGGVTLRVISRESEDKICSILHPLSQANHQRNLTSPASALQFEVIDTGVGMAAQEATTIFDAFVQADAGKKTMSGTGLGLTISRKLLDLMGGKISVQSIPHGGSTFTATIPVCPTSGVDVHSAQQNRTVIGLVPGQAHHRVLIVDDQRENRLLMVRLLTQLGLEVREAINGQEAIAIWQDWQPDLTWMDIRMPGVDGYEATKQIRAMEHEKASIIIALTAQASQSDRTLALAAGCNDYISKPFREETVFLKMSEYLGLEYLYAASDDAAEPLASASAPGESSNISLISPAMLAQISVDSRMALEDAAICGNDRAIAQLTTQLPPDLAPLSNVLVDLANTFQFEQILALLNGHSS